MDSRPGNTGVYKPIETVYNRYVMGNYRTDKEGAYMEKVFEIPTSIFEDFVKKFKRIEKVAKKLGVTGYSYEILGTEMSEIAVSEDAVKLLEIDESKLGTIIEERVIEDFEVDGRTVKGWTEKDVKKTIFAEITKIKVSGEMPVVGEYNFVGLIDPSGISRSAPGENIPAKLLKKIGSCDHCKKIRNRSKTLVVRKGKTYKVVGSACIKDFLGTGARDLENIAKNFTEYLEFFWFANKPSDMGFFGGGNIVPEYKLKDVLKDTYAVIKTYGWVSKGMAFNNEDLASTAEWVSVLLNGPTVRRNGEPTLYDKIVSDLVYGTTFKPLKDGEENSLEKAKIASEEGGLLDKAIEWAKDLGKDNDKDYLRNLSILAESGTVTSKEIGLTCSLISSYEREMGRELEKAERKESFMDRWGNSVFMGEKGEKIIANVEVLRISEFVGNFGPVEIIKMGTDDGNILTWFSSSRTPVEISEKGGKATIKGTVKGTNEYKGVKETLVTRVKIAA